MKTESRKEGEYSEDDTDSLQCNLALHIVQALRGIAMRLA